MTGVFTPTRTQAYITPKFTCYTVDTRRSTKVTRSTAARKVTSPWYTKTTPRICVNSVKNPNLSLQKNARNQSQNSVVAGRCNYNFHGCWLVDCDICWDFDQQKTAMPRSNRPEWCPNHSKSQRSLSDWHLWFHSQCISYWCLTFDNGLAKFLS